MKKGFSKIITRKAFFLGFILCLSFFGITQRNSSDLIEVLNPEEIGKSDEIGYFNPANAETLVMSSKKRLVLNLSTEQQAEINRAKRKVILVNEDSLQIESNGTLVLNQNNNTDIDFNIFVDHGDGFQTLKGLPKKGCQITFVEELPRPPFFTQDTIVFGFLLLLLALVFYTSSLNGAFWTRFYIILPSLLLCYLLPSIFSSLNIISSEWIEPDQFGNGLTVHSEVYYVASRFLLPAALVLMTLSLDLKAVLKLGWKALAMFLTGTVGIILGGPIAILIVGFFSPETVGGEGFDAVWRGLSTLAGSWIGGGANQTAMLEVYKYNQDSYGAMVLVDIVVANIWMAVLLFGIGKKERIDKWFKADNSDIDELKEKVSNYEKSVMRIPSLKDFMIILGIAFTAVALAHWGADFMVDTLKAYPSVQDPKNFLNTFAGQFFWLVSLITLFGVALSFTPLKKFEGAGASKMGSVFIYILVASIGMKMDLKSVVENPGLLVVGLIWMAVHALLLIGVAKLIKAPYFFLAVGSKANVGGAASAPIVASAFHPSLASVGVILAIFGYVLGTVGALICAELMRLIAQM